jgi:hypothetical protein
MLQQVFITRYQVYLHRHFGRFVDLTQSPADINIIGQLQWALAGKGFYLPRFQPN